PRPPRRPARRDPRRRRGEGRLHPAGRRRRGRGRRDRAGGALPGSGRGPADRRVRPGAAAARRPAALGQHLRRRRGRPPARGGRAAGAERAGGGVSPQPPPAQARRYQYTASPLTRAIDVVIKILSLVAVALAGLYTAVYWVTDYHDVAAVEFPELIWTRPREA